MNLFLPKTTFGLVVYILTFSVSRNIQVLKSILLEYHKEVIHLLNYSVFVEKTQKMFNKHYFPLQTTTYFGFMIDSNAVSLMFS